MRRGMPLWLVLLVVAVEVLLGFGILVAMALVALHFISKFW